MRNILIAICLLATSVAMADNKFIYDVPSGNITEETPMATAGSGSAILGARVWYINNGTPALGLTPNLYWTNTEDPTNPMVMRYNNVSELASWTNLWPITEDQRQALKDPDQKQLENNFQVLWQYLGFPEKPGFGGIWYMLSDWTNQNQAVQFEMFGLGLDSNLRLYDPSWWDDCAWHPESPSNSIEILVPAAFK